MYASCATVTVVSDPAYYSQILSISRVSEHTDIFSIIKNKMGRNRPKAKARDGGEKPEKAAAKKRDEDLTLAELQ